MIALLLALALAQDTDSIPSGEPAPVEPVEQMAADLEETQGQIDEIARKLDEMIEALAAACEVDTACLPLAPESDTEIDPVESPAGPS